MLLSIVVFCNISLPFFKYEVTTRSTTDEKSVIVVLIVSGESSCWKHLFELAERVYLDLLSVSLPLVLLVFRNKMQTVIVKKTTAECEDKHDKRKFEQKKKKKIRKRKRKFER